MVYIYFVEDLGIIEKGSSGDNTFYGILQKSPMIDPQNEGINKIMTANDYSCIIYSTMIAGDKGIKLMEKFKFDDDTESFTAYKLISSLNKFNKNKIDRNGLGKCTEIKKIDLNENNEMVNFYKELDKIDKNDTVLLLPHRIKRYLIKGQTEPIPQNKEIIFNFSKDDKKKYILNTSGKTKQKYILTLSLSRNIF